MTNSINNRSIVFKILVCGTSRCLGFIFFLRLLFARRFLTLFLFLLGPEALEEIEDGQDYWQLVKNFLHCPLNLDALLAFGLRAGC